MNQLISTIVLASAKHAKWVLLGLLALFLMALFYSNQHFKINSDLGQLIKPSADTTWYSDNEQFKQQFPEYQDTALVVVTGNNAREVDSTAKALLDKLQQEPSFKHIFAPQLQPFMQQRVLYAMPLEGVKRFTQAVDKQYVSLQTLLETPSLSAYSYYLLSQIEQDKQQYFLSDNTKTSLKHFNKAVAKTAQNASNKTLPRILHPFVAQDDGQGFVQLISLKAQVNFAEKLPNAKVVATLKDIIGKTDKPETVNVAITGELMLAHEEVQAGLSGVEIAGVISLVLLLLILSIGLRSKAMITAIFILLLAGSAMTTALGLLLVGSFNTLSLIFLVMFFGLGVDFAVHFSSKIVEDLQQRLNYREALIDTVNDMGTVLVLCALSTSIAFLSFLPTDYKGLGELGLVSAGGMLVALILSLVFLPAWFACFKLPVKPAHKTKGAARKPWPMAKAKKLSWLLLLVAAILAAGSASLLPKVGFDFSVLALRNTDTEGMKTLLDLQRRGEITDYSIAILLDDNDQQVQQKIQKLEALDTVANVISVHDVVPKFQALKQQAFAPMQDKIASLQLGEKPIDNALYPATVADINKRLNIDQQDIFIDDDAKLLKDFKQALSTSIKPGFNIKALQTYAYQGLAKDLALLQAWFKQQPFTADDLPENIRKRFISPQGKQLLTVLPAKALDSRADMQGFIESVKTVAKHPAGRAMVEWGVGNVVVQSFIKASMIAAVLIFVLLLLYFKNVLLALAVMLPLTLSCLLTMAVVALSGLSLNMANILVVPLIFGLGVDTGIHVVHRYFSNEGVASLYQSSTFKAVVISALTTIGTFLSLLLSPHKGAASIGLLLALAIGLMLVLSFSVLPALLLVLDSRNTRNKKGQPCN